MSGFATYRALETNCAKFGLAMRSLMQSMLVVMVALGLLAAADNFAQSPSPNSDIVLEVIVTQTTMASEDRYVYLYLRVFSDSTAECQSLKHSNSEKKELLTVKKALTQDEFIRIKSVVSEPKLAAVGPKYETRYAIVDTSTEWTIKIQRPGQPQIIQVLEFSPGLARTMKHPYPDPLVKLGCNIEKLRADVSGESNTLDSECKRVLGTASQPKSRLTHKRYK
jgi:hypothetical protein